MSMLDDAIQTIRMGNRDEGRRLLEEILETDENNEEVWLWLSSVVDSDEDREVCLENVLALNPNNVVAQKGLEALRSGTFNVQDLMSEAIEDEPISGSTFLDDFRRSADSLDEDEELVMPSTMAKSKGKGTKQKTAKKGGFKLNPRLILLAVFVVFIILALGSLAVARVFLGGEDAGDTGAPVVQPSQETPVEGGEPPATDQPPAVDTAPPLPTDTPTPTNTPFQLPTPKPTDLPTPTATPVVPPTPF